MEKKLANIDRQKKEENLRQLAQKARNTRIGIKETAPNEGRDLHVSICEHQSVLYLNILTWQYGRGHFLVSVGRDQVHVGKPVLESIGSVVEYMYIMVEICIVRYRIKCPDSSSPAILAGL